MILKIPYEYMTNKTTAEFSTLKTMHCITEIINKLFSNSFSVPLNTSILGRYNINIILDSRS